MYRRVIIIVSLLLGIWACQPKAKESIAFDLPASVPAMQMVENNPATRAGIELGRFLFYDPILSADSSQSCASCHFQDLAFSDPSPQSVGVLGLRGDRNAMSLANVGLYYTGLFWDGRVQTLEEQSLHPIADRRELAGDWQTILARLHQSELYFSKFKTAFNIKSKADIQPDLVSKALAQFERSLLSFDSKFDKVERGELEFTLSELRGWTIFFDANTAVPAAECNHCHIDPLFSNLKYENNGLQELTANGDYTDNGLGTISGKKYDNGKFRVPTLRNIALTAPYMHDGSLATLEEVVEHYNSGGHYGENVSPNVRPLLLSGPDKKDLIAFLNTLTDSTFINNEAYSNPFYDKTLENTYIY